MICTANYVARRFGVRSAMPGFIAKKLCPQVCTLTGTLSCCAAQGQTSMRGSSALPHNQHHSASPVAAHRASFLTCVQRNTHLTPHQLP